jgi:hypothetical protein
MKIFTWASWIWVLKFFFYLVQIRNLLPVFRILINLIRIRIRIQHFRLNTDPDPIRIQGFDDEKLEKLYNWKFV